MADALTGQGFDFIIDFFQESAIQGLSNLYPYSQYLLIVISILVIGMTWNLYSGELKMQWVVMKIMHFGFIQLLIMFWNVFVRWTYVTLASIGMTAAAGSDSFEIIKPSSIMNKGFEISKEITANASFWSTEGWFLMIAAFLTIIAFWFISFQMTLTLIIYYIISVAAIFLIPMGMIPFLKSYFQKAIGGVINLSVRIMIMFFMVGLINKFITNISLKAAQNASDFEYVKNALIIFTLGYLTYKIPEIASDILSGNPSFGNSATSAIGGAIGGYAGAKAAQMGGSVKRITGAAAYTAVDHMAPGFVDTYMGGSKVLAAAEAARKLGKELDSAMLQGDKNDTGDSFDKAGQENMKMIHKNKTS